MKYNPWVSMMIFVLLGSACVGGIGTPTPDFDATLEIALQQTLAAQPTNTTTIVPTSTPTIAFTPTATYTQTATYTPTATEEPMSFTVEVQEDGWSQYVYHEDGFVISLPPNWVHLDLTADDIDEMLSVASENDQQLGGLLSSEYLRVLVAAGIKFYAIDSDKDSLTAGIPTSMNILVADLPFELSLKDYVEVNIQQLRMMMGEDLVIQQERVEIDNIEAELIAYESEMMDPYGQAHIVAFRQFLMLKGSMQYVITFGTQSEFVGTNETVFDTIVESFAFTH